MVGNPGWPLLMIDGQNDFGTMTVRHWNPEITVGDRLLVGRTLETAWTYLVTAQGPDPADARSLRARLIRHNDRIGVSGVLI